MWLVAVTAIWRTGHSEELSLISGVQCDDGVAKRSVGAIQLSDKAVHLLACGPEHPVTVLKSFKYYSLLLDKKIYFTFLLLLKISTKLAIFESSLIIQWISHLILLLLLIPVALYYSQPLHLPC